jgi:hypothetical protein
MRHISRLCAAAGAAALLVVTSTSAFGDVVYNDIDDVDTIAEVVNLQYDATHSVAGPSGTTRLAIDVDGALVADPGVDHPGCNIGETGDSQYLTLRVAQTPSHVSLAFPDGLTFDACSDVLRVVVTPTSVGTDQIAFEIDSVRANKDPRTAFQLGTATFDAVVQAADLSQDPGTGTKCDKNPAAPAWAAALLQANHLKARTKDGRNVVKLVARQMERRASFPSPEGPVAKDADHRAYPKAVLAYMRDELGLSLTKGLDDVKRPGWVCTTVG